MMQLEKGRDYLLVADFADSYGTEFINVGMVLHVIILLLHVYCILDCYPYIVLNTH